MDCAFCDLDRERSENNVLFESDNFYAVPALHGAIAPGHILMISKEHIPCYSVLPVHMHAEFNSFKRYASEKVSSNFAVPILSELGDYHQSIPHAHIHIFPSKSGHYSIDGLVKAVPPEIIINELESLDGLIDIFNRDGEYVSIEENGKLYVCRTKGYTGELIRFRDLFVKLTGLEEFRDWRKMDDASNARNSKWIEETKMRLGE